ncbi:MAG: HEAT repeat domain-containing protein [Dysgonomonas sp.]
MFDFWEFYKELSVRTSYFDNYWDQFPQGRLLRFKKETLSLLRDVVEKKDAVKLSNIIAIIFNDGADKDYTDILLPLLGEKWHTSEEDIVEVLELIKDPKSVDKLYETAINIPDYDDMRSLAKKCMWALSAIKTPEAIEKLKLLQTIDDQIIKENAVFQLANLSKS